MVVNHVGAGLMLKRVLTCGVNSRVGRNQGNAVVELKKLELNVSACFIKWVVWLFISQPISIILLALSSCLYLGLFMRWCSQTWAQWEKSWKQKHTANTCMKHNRLHFLRVLSTCDCIIYSMEALREFGVQTSVMLSTYSTPYTVVNIQATRLMCAIAHSTLSTMCDQYRNNI